MLDALAGTTGLISIHPSKISPSPAAVLLFGSGKKNKFLLRRRGRRFSHERAFMGSYPTWTVATKKRIHPDPPGPEPLYEHEHMPDCAGSRLRQESLFIKIDNHSIHDITKLSIKEALTFFAGLTLSSRDKKIAERVLKEINERLSFLVQVGVDYLTLDRTSTTLSGGEGQRIRLATQIGSSLVGCSIFSMSPVWASISVTMSSSLRRSKN